MRSQLLMGRRAAFRARLGLPRPADRAAGREGAGPRTRRTGSSVAEFRSPVRSARAASSSTSCAASSSGSAASGNWDNPYLTLSQDYEATIVRQLAAFARAGCIYRDKKPVHWCVVHRTALAEAEVEYDDHTLAVDLCPLPGRRRSPPWKADPRLEARRSPSSSGRPPPGPCRPTWRSSPTRSWTTSAFPPHGRGRHRIPDRRRGAWPRRSWPPCGLAAPAAADVDRRSQRPSACARLRRRSATSTPFPSQPRSRPRLPPVLRPPRHAGGRHRPGAHRARATAPTTTSSAARTASRSTRPSTPRAATPPEVRRLGRG